MQRDRARNNERVFPFSIFHRLNISILRCFILYNSFLLDQFYQSSNILQNSSVDSCLTDRGFLQINTSSPHGSGLRSTRFGTLHQIDGPRVSSEDGLISLGLTRQIDDRGKGQFSSLGVGRDKALSFFLTSARGISAVSFALNDDVLFVGAGSGVVL